MSLNGAQLAAKHALTTLQGVLAQADPVIQIYERFLQATFANTVPILADFALEPRKEPAPKTSEEKAAAVAKAKATRVARGTTSKKLKLLTAGGAGQRGSTLSGVAPPHAACCLPFPRVEHLADLADQRFGCDGFL
jgi:hypothetical protein